MSDTDAYRNMQTNTDEAEELALAAEAPAAPVDPADLPAEAEQDWRDVVRDRATQPALPVLEVSNVVEDARQIATSAGDEFLAEHGLVTVAEQAAQVSKELADLRDLRSEINFRIKHLVVYAAAFDSMERIASKARTQIGALEDDDPDSISGDG